MNVSLKNGVMEKDLVTVIKRLECDKVKLRKTIHVKDKMLKTVEIIKKEPVYLVENS